MDLMLDKRMKVWMCEVNTDPGLGLLAFWTVAWLRGYPDKEVLGSPNPDYKKELSATCRSQMHQNALPAEWPGLLRDLARPILSTRP